MTTLLSDENKIDLFADEEDVNQLSNGFDTAMADEEKHDTETDTLFDDVVTARLGVTDEMKDAIENPKAVEDCGAAATEGQGGNEPLPPAAQKFNAYVGNLTWWTTDQEIENLLLEIGVDDLIEIKFYDSRLNGQSKSYCNVCVASERSIRLVHEKLSTKVIHEKRIMVAPASKAAAAQFEALSECKPRVAPNNGCVGACNVRGPGPMQAGIPPPPQPYGMPPGPPRMVGGPPRGNRLPGPPGSGMNSPPNPRMGMCPPHPSQGPNSGPPHHYGPQRPHGMPPFHHHNQRPYRPFHQSGHPPCSFPPSPGMDHHRGGPPPQRNNEWMRMPGPNCPPVNHPPPSCPIPGLMLHPPPSQEILGSPPGIGNDPLPAPHVNPAFFQPQFPSPVPSPESRPNRTPKARDHLMTTNSYESPSPRLDECRSPNHIKRLMGAELDEIVNRNRTVSTTAISRAVDDAAKGDFAGAIETLVTAISLIRQSRVGNDERCKILVTSLQDTLHGIESKSYGHVRVRMRSKSRSRSRERASLRAHRSRHHYHYSHRRSRSRSRGRSRSRERYYDRRRSRSRSLSSSRGSNFESRSSKSDDRERYHHYRDNDRERYKREYEHREREHGSGSSSKLSLNSSGRGHEPDEEQDHEHDHRSSRR